MSSYRFMHHRPEEQGKSYSSASFSPSPSDDTIMASSTPYPFSLSPSPQASGSTYCAPPEPEGVTIGAPIYFSTGPYAGRVIRMEIQEIQKANLGRKYASVDRRPLDPPPVAHLRMFEVFHAGTHMQREIEVAYDDVLAHGLVCFADLFPVPPDEDTLDPGPYAYGSYGSGPSTSAAPSSSSPVRYGPSTRTEPYPSYRELRSKADSYSSTHAAVPQQPKVIHTWGDFPITEESKKTKELVGSTFVQPSVVDYQGSKQMFFVFADLAVRLEGFFILRYRVFNLEPTQAASPKPVTAECYGDRFRVYSTKEFPGLPASTEFTKLLARYGVRVNLRETERKRRRRDDDGSPDY